MQSRTDWARLRSAQDMPSPTDEHPQADVRHIVGGIVRRGLKPVPQKTSISLRVDQDVLDWFRQTGPRYQTRMNAVLRTYMTRTGKRAPRARRNGHHRGVA